MHSSIHCSRHDQADERMVSVTYSKAVFPQYAHLVASLSLFFPQELQCMYLNVRVPWRVLFASERPEPIELPKAEGTRPRAVERSVQVVLV